MLSSRRSQAGAVGILLIVLFVVAYFLTRTSAATPSPARLQIYVGTVQVSRGGSSGFADGQTGQVLNEGDTVRTLAQSKAAINFADGSLTRLDSSTSVLIKVSTHPGNAYNVELAQSAGKTWNSVKALVGGSTYKVDGPNNSVAEARGTAYLFAILPGGNEKADDFTGSIDFSVGGKTQHLTAGNFSQSGPNGPTAPAPISAADLADPFVLFNKAADANPGTAQTGIGPDNTLSTSQSSINEAGYTADGNSDLAFTLSWPGSTFGIVLIGPDGTEYPEQSSSTPPYTVIATKAVAGNWSYRVHDITSSDNEPWEIVIGKISPSTGTPQVIFPLPPGTCQYTVTAGQTETHKFKAYSYSGVVTFKASTDLPSGSLPDYATLTDNKDGTASVTFAPPIDLAATVDIVVTVTASQGAGSRPSSCIEHVLSGKSSSIGGSVLANGAGVGGVAMTLTMPDGTIQTAATDGSGGYGFPGLGAGAYSVTMTVPGGYRADTTSQSETVDGATAGAPLNFSLIPFGISQSALPNGSVGDPFCSVLTLAGAVGSVSWSVAGTLPTGTGLDQFGHCSGTPSAAGSFAFTVTATDSAGNRASHDYSVQIFSAPHITAPLDDLAFAPIDNLKPWDTGFANPQTLTGTGGIAPYTWSVVSGALPKGMSIGAGTGTIGGAPSVGAGDYAVGIQLTDSVGSKAYRDVFIRVQRPPLFLYQPSPTFIVRGQEFNRQLSIDAEAEPVTLTTSGLPPGISAAVYGTLCYRGCEGSGIEVRLTGTPTATGTFTPTFTIRDPSGGTASQSDSITVVFPGLAITTASLPQATVGAPYSQQVVATGGTGPSTRTWYGGLPPGLAVDQSGLVSGIPTQAGCYPNTSISVYDSASSAYATFPMNVLPAASGIAICSSSSLPSGESGQPYSQQLSAIGGSGPLTWSMSGQSPPSLSLSPSGLLTSAAFTAQESPYTWSFQVLVTDGKTRTPQSVSLVVYSAPALTTASGPLAAGSTDGTTYQVNLTTAGTPYPPVGLTVKSGTLPPGLALFSSNACYPSPDACIFGHPTQGGTFSFSLAPTDGLGIEGPAVAYSIAVTPGALVFGNPGPNLSTGMVGTSYGDGFDVSGGSQPYNWSRTGSLPPGLSAAFDAGNVSITGTPTAAGSYTSTYQVTDNDDSIASISYTIVIDPTLAFVTAVLPSGDVNTDYSQPVTVTGGTGSGTYTFALSCVPTVLSGCTYPSGLAIDSNTGTISAPDRVSQPMTYRFFVDVTDADSNRASRMFSITFAPQPQITRASLPDATIGSSYCQSLSAAGGTPGYSWALASGALPTGIALDSFGHLTGTPTVGGTYTFSVTATDANGVAAGASYTVTIS